MKRRNIVASLAAAFLLNVGCHSDAGADVIGYGSFTISNLNLYLGSGTGTLLPSNAIATETTNTTATAAVNGLSGGGTSIGLDSALQCIGNCAGIGENNFSRVSDTLSQGASFARGDSLASGSITGSPGLTSQLVVETRIAGDTQSAATAGTSTTKGIRLDLVLSEASYLTLWFQALLDWYLEVDDKPDSAVGLTSHFSIELKKGLQTLFSWSPDSSSGLVVAEGAGLDLNIDPSLFTGGTAGTASDSVSGSFLATTAAMIDPGAYSLVISHTLNTEAITVPEPASLALMGMALLLAASTHARIRRKAAAKKA